MEAANLDVSPLDEVIPIVFALVIGAIVISAQWLIYRLKRARIEAMREALLSRTDLDPDSITALLGQRPTAQSDLRKAILWGSTCAGLLLGTLVLPVEIRSAMLAAAIIAGALGNAYSVLMVLRLHDRA
ncbi:MAG: hypothetical protein AAFX04_09010 [Pseudomonadota bacterium]